MKKETSIFAGRNFPVILLLLVGLLFLSFVGCGYRSTRDKSISRSDLAFIHEGISYDNIVAKIGEPKRDVSSGVYLFEYDLEDGGTPEL